MSAGYYRVGTYYVDNTTPSNPVLYRCITAGTNSTSVWAKVTGAGNVAEAYNNAHAYVVGNIIWLDTTTTIGGITILPGTYLCILGVPTSGTANQIPQFPLPTSGSVYWRCISFGAAVVNVCTSGGNQQVYGNFSGSF